MIIKTLKYNLDDLIVPTAVLGGAFLLLEAVIAVILYAVHPDTTATLGGVLLPAFALLLVVILDMTHPVMTFEVMLRFSVTRRGALASVLATMFFETAYTLGLGYLLGGLDGFIARSWARALPWIRSVEMTDVTFPLWSLPLAVVLIVLLALGAGAALQRFGRRAFWVLWAVWMVFILGVNQVDWERLLGLHWLIPVLAVAALAAAVWGAWSLLRASVRR